MRHIDMIFFDAGGTLIAPREDVGEVYARTAERYGLAAPPAAVLAAFFDAFHAKKLDGQPQDRDWWRDVVAETFAAFGTPTDPAALFADLYEHFTAPDAWVLAPGALQTVRTLRARGYRTGLISNWDDRLPGILEGLGLAALLDPVVVSYRVGAEKPDARIYEVALREAGTRPERSLMIGDDYEADIAGARALGFGAIQVRRHGQKHDGAIVIDELPELLTLLSGPAGSTPETSP